MARFFCSINFGLFHLWRRGWGGGRHTSSRTFTPISRRIWPKLPAHMLSRLVHMGAPCSHYFFFLEEPFGLRQWAPRSVGPYGVGRAPTPLMHAPAGACIWAPLWGAHYRSRLFFLFVARPPFGLPALMGHPRGCPICAPRRGAHYITCVCVCTCKRVREAPKGAI